MNDGHIPVAYDHLDCAKAIHDRLIRQLLAPGIRIVIIHLTQSASIVVHGRNDMVDCLHTIDEVVRNIVRAITKLALDDRRVLEDDGKAICRVRKGREVQGSRSFPCLGAV